MHLTNDGAVPIQKRCRSKHGASLPTESRSVTPKHDHFARIFGIVRHIRRNESERGFRVVRSKMCVRALALYVVGDAATSAVAQLALQTLPALPNGIAAARRRRLS